MKIVYLNGRFVPQENATISIMDRGFLFGDGIYEVIPVFDGLLFGLKEHLIRMDKSLAAIGMTNPLSHTDWKKLLEQLLLQNDIGNKTVNCYCQVTRGADDTRKHIYPDNLTPTVVAFITPMSTKTEDKLNSGFNAITLDDTRRRDCHIKAITLLPNILNMKQANISGALEAILIRNEEVLECTSSNVFIVKDGIILTPPISPLILNGVTRNTVLSLAQENNIPTKEIVITPDMLFAADEVWITGSSKEICPIVKVDNHIIGDGLVGPLWKRIHSLYQSHKQQLIQANKATYHHDIN